MIRIGSTISKSRVATPGAWFVTTAATDPDALPADRYVLGTFALADSFTEAITLAHQQRHALADELMDAVHADRAERRAAVHRHPSGRIEPTLTAHQTLTNIHELEPTA